MLFVLMIHIDAFKMDHMSTGFHVQVKILFFFENSHFY